MSQFYANLANTAASLLQTYGQEVKFTRATQGTYDPTTGLTAFSTVTFKGYGAVLAYQSGEVDGQTILSSDLKLLLQAGTKNPQVGDTAQVGALSYLVFATNQVSPGGTPVVTECQLRVGDPLNELR